MKRRLFLKSSAALSASAMLSNVDAAIADSQWSDAEQVLRQATDSGMVSAAAMVVEDPQGSHQFACGLAKTPDAIFLLASITKPMCVAALMKLYDAGEFRLEDPVQRFIPDFRGAGREKIQIRHLLTHVSGLPDQLPENTQLRKQHAPLATFVQHAIRTPLMFPAGARYSYSSMGILLAADIARRISGMSIHAWMQQALFRPLGMKHSVLGLGEWKLDQMMKCQTQKAAPESGAGDVSATDWDWNSKYWRAFGAPWGGAHGSAVDVARFLRDFLNPSEKVLRPTTAKLMITNQNPSGMRKRGLGFGVGAKAGSPGCSEQTFGHTGSTGTLAWADPKRSRICVVLTTLPGAAVKPHPRQLVSDIVAKRS